MWPRTAAPNPGSALIFLGTGCSSAVPNAMCLIQPSDPPCNVCFQSLSVPPDRNPNYRCNTSLLIDYCGSDGKHRYYIDRCWKDVQGTSAWVVYFPEDTLDRFDCSDP